MLVKGRRSLRDLHSAIALLNNLGNRNQSIKGNVDSLGSDDCRQQLFQGNNDRPNRILGVEILVKKAVEIQSQTIHFQRSISAFPLNVFVASQERCYVIRNSHCLFSQGVRKRITKLTNLELYPPWISELPAFNTITAATTVPPIPEIAICPMDRVACALRSWRPPKRSLS